MRYNAPMNAALLPASPAFLSTGAAGLDAALGGGFARGRIAEMFGPDLAPCRALALATLAAAQAAGLTVALVDVAHAFEPGAVGIDAARLIVSHPDTVDQALDIVEALARSAAIDLVVVDDVSSMQGAEEGGALLARRMSRALRKLTLPAERTGCAVLFLNRVTRREWAYGPSETTSGGNALKYFSTARVDLRRGGDADGNPVLRARVVKNKLAPPFASCLLPLPLVSP